MRPVSILINQEFVVLNREDEVWVCDKAWVANRVDEVEWPSLLNGGSFEVFFDGFAKAPQMITNTA